jgi:hypothetical protein
MTKTLLTSITLFFLFTLTSCSKYFTAPEDRLEGTWKLNNVIREGSWRRETINTGYENGLFNFYNNGSAQYEDNAGRLNGRWNLQRTNHGYYDANGNYREENNLIFSINLADFRNNDYLRLDFDDCWFNGSSRFIAVYYTASYQYRYEFVRY